MNPVITSVNGINVVSIKEFGGIAPVFITPEKTLTVQGTGFTKGMAIAAIGLNEVGTETVNVSVKSFKIGKTINDFLELIDGVSIGDLLGGIGGSIFDDFVNDIDDITNVIMKKADILRSPDVPVKSGASADPVNQLNAYVPSVWEFQTTDLDLFGFKCKYECNTIVMPFAVCVWDFINHTHSTPIIIAAVLPLPAVGKPHVTGRSVLIGAVPGPSRDNTDHFGALAPKDSNNKPIPNTGGEVRWYEPSMLAQLSTFDLGAFFGAHPEISVQPAAEASTLWNWLLNAVAKPGQAMLGEVFAKLAAIRKAGESLTVHDWHNEGVLFDIPQKKLFGTAGLAVVWRDDLPSKPVPILNLACDCSNPQEHDQIEKLIQAAACRLWSFLPSFRSDKALLPGEAITFGLQRLAQGMDNLLARLLDSNESGITIKFKFAVDSQNVKITRVSTASEIEIRPDEYSDGIVPMAVDPENPFQIKFLATPDVVSQDDSGTGKYITVKLYAEIAFSPACVFRDIQIGPSFTFKQLPIKIPTIAIFFTGATCGNVPLFLLPKDTGIVPQNLRGVHWDIDGINPPVSLKSNQTLLDAMNEVRVKILSALTLAKEVLYLAKPVSDLFKEPWMEQLEGALAHLISSASFVVDTNGSINDLGKCVYGRNAFGAAESFGRRIESVLLIGPPSDLAGKYFKCYTDLDGRGAELKLTIPQNTWIAALGNLRNFNEALSVGDSTLPLIQCAVSPAGISPIWGGAIASIYFE
jgi:hypothetical protein